MKELFITALIGVAVAYIGGRTEAHQDKKPEPTMQSGIEMLTLGTAPVVEIVVVCKNASPPSDCHLTEGHTLDDVMRALWQQDEDRRVMYRDEAEMLKRRVKLIPSVKGKVSKPKAQIETPKEK